MSISSDDANGVSTVCYKCCNEKFYPGHRCKNKELQVLVVQDSEVEDYDQAEEGVIVEPTEGVEGMVTKVEVALNSKVGFSEPLTIKMLGSIQDRRVVFLINGGAIHNFLAIVIADGLRLLIALTTAYGVKTG